MTTPDNQKPRLVIVPKGDQDHARNMVDNVLEPLTGSQTIVERLERKINKNLSEYDKVAGIFETLFKKYLTHLKEHQETDDEVDHLCNEISDIVNKVILKPKTVVENLTRETTIHSSFEFLLEPEDPNFMESLNDFKYSLLLSGMLSEVIVEWFKENFNLINTSPDVDTQTPDQTQIHYMCDHIEMEVEPESGIVKIHYKLQVVL